jgi:hypothetical protein
VATAPASVLTSPFLPPGEGAPEPAPAVRQERVTVTPETAKAWLARNGANRPVVFGMAYLLLGRKDPEQAREFLDRLLDGADIGRGHPVHTLRATIWKAREDERRLNEHEQLFLLVLAWNHLRAGNTACLQLKLPSGGLTPKNFPEPK